MWEFVLFQSLYHDRQGVPVVPPTVPGAFLGLPEKGTIKKQKSIGMIHINTMSFVRLAHRNILLSLQELSVC